MHAFFCHLVHALFSHLLHCIVLDSECMSQGLVNALETHFPQAEHRFCVMHLSKNLQLGFKGVGIRNLMWAAAKSTTPYFFKKNMENMKKVSMLRFI